MNVRHITTVDSTNVEAGRILSDGSMELPFAVFTDFQTAGRGQGNHTWSSTHSKNITVSVTIEPKLPPEKQFYITALASVSIKQTVDYILCKFNLPLAKIKWINDVYVGDNKIAGILISNDILDNKITHSIIGIGLNVNQEEFPVDIPNPTSLKIESGKDFDIEEVLSLLLNNIEKNIEIMRSHPEDLRKLYEENLYKLNEPHSYTINGKQETRRIKGVDEFGGMVY